MEYLSVKYKDKDLLICIFPWPILIFMTWQLRQKLTKRLDRLYNMNCLIKKTISQIFLPTHVCTFDPSGLFKVKHD